MIRPINNNIYVKMLDSSDEWGFDNGIGMCGEVISSCNSDASVGDVVWFLRCTKLGDGTAIVNYDKCTLIKKKQ